MLVINNRLVELSSETKISRHIKARVQWMKENLSENGKDIVFVWDDSKQKKALHSRVVRGFSQGEHTTPRGHMINMSALAPVFQEEEEGLSDVVYLRRAPQQDGGVVVNIKREKEMFAGRIVVNIARQPDLAFFLYYCCPQCRDGANSNGSNVFKVQNREADAVRRNEQLRLKVKIQALTLNDEKQGGLSSAALAKFVEDILGYKGVEKLTPERMREYVHEQCIKNPDKAAMLLKFAEGLKVQPPQPPQPPPQPVIEEDDFEEEEEFEEEEYEEEDEQEFGDDFQGEDFPEELEPLPEELPVIPETKKPPTKKTPAQRKKQGTRKRRVKKGTTKK